MRDGAILSGLLHGVVVLLLLIGMPDFLRRELEPPPIIPIEIINIADVTKASDLKVKPKDDSPKKEVEEKPQPPKPTPVAEKTPDPEPEKKPDPEPDVEPELTMDDLLAPIVEEKAKEEKPKEKPKEKKKESLRRRKKKPKPKKDFMTLLNNIDKTESSSEGPTQPEQDGTQRLTMRPIMWVSFRLQRWISFGANWRPVGTFLLVQKMGKICMWTLN